MPMGTNVNPNHSPDNIKVLQPPQPDTMSPVTDRLDAEKGSQTLETQGLTRPILKPSPNPKPSKPKSTKASRVPPATSKSAVPKNSPDTSPPPEKSAAASAPSTVVDAGEDATTLLQDAAEIRSKMKQDAPDSRDIHALIEDAAKDLDRKQRHIEALTDEVMIVFTRQNPLRMVKTQWARAVFIRWVRLTREAQDFLADTIMLQCEDRDLVRNLVAKMLTYSNTVFSSKLAAQKVMFLIGTACFTSLPTEPFDATSSSPASTNTPSQGQGG